MSKRNRKRYSAEFKAKVALAALKEDATLSEIAARFEIYPNMVSLWKCQAVEGVSSLFTGKANRYDVSQETRIKELHEKIGQLTVERDFLARAFGPRILTP